MARRNSTLSKVNLLVAWFFASNSLRSGVLGLNRSFAEENLSVGSFWPQKDGVGNTRGMTSIYNFLYNHESSKTLFRNLMCACSPYLAGVHDKCDNAQGSPMSPILPTPPKVPTSPILPTLPKCLTPCPP